MVMCVCVPGGSRVSVCLGCCPISLNVAHQLAVFSGSMSFLQSFVRMECVQKY